MSTWSLVGLVRSGVLAKYKSDSSGRRQIVALRFAGEGILPNSGRTTDYGLQATLQIASQTLQLSLFNYL